MATENFRSILRSGRELFLDGAMGTMLQARGLPAGMPPEKFCLEHPDLLRDIHEAYLQAGANIITTCTFGANKYKLPADLDVYETNKSMARIAREALGANRHDAFVAGDVGPTGLFLKPLGPLSPEELIAAFRAQISGLAAGGADLIFMETQFDLAETRAALVAARQVCNLPVMVSMTFEDGLSLTGSTAEIFAETMLNMGADVIGTNCSLGPDEMLPVIKELLASPAPCVMAEPNAGLPELRDGKTIFPLPPDLFAEKTAPFAAMGVQILGGCCGTSPAHIRALVQAVKERKCQRKAPESRGITLTSRSRLLRAGGENPLLVIGERINPTGKPKLAAQLREGEFGEALRLADEQIAAGADALDINVGAPMVDEKKILPELATLLIGRHLAPLCLDSPNVDAIVNALPCAPGSCLVNSISGEAGKMDLLGPICKLYGAPFILLPLQGAKLPVTAAERISIAEHLLSEAQNLGIPSRLIMVDALALSVSSKSGAGRECLKMIAWCKERGLASTLGLSNISFGLPARDLLNGVFLALCRGAGLSSCIVNPSAPRVQEAFCAMRALLGSDTRCENFIAMYGNWKSADNTQRQDAKGARARTLAEAVILGDLEGAPDLLEKELQAGAEPLALVNEALIPAINDVGEKYGRKEYFLPQLIRSAETMRLAFEKLKPLLAKSGGLEKKPVIVMATVEGDIHDIGKNIVSLMLGNHGFEVIDAGKDVPAREIVDLAKKEGAKIIGLSALMTTTMPRMEDTIRLVREEGLDMRVMVGGAAVTPEFARAIGADAYSEDAVDATRVAAGLLAAS